MGKIQVSGLSSRMADWARERLSLRARRRIAFARLRIRRLTSRHRMLPDFLVIGTQRGGTSSLYRYLGRHPWVAPSLRKEIEYFTRSYGEGEPFYRAHFPLEMRRAVWRLAGRRLVTFEATPDYLVHPLAAERASALLPDAKLIALLREPIGRALSHYRHNVRLGFEDRSFDDAIDADVKTMREELETVASVPEHSPKHLLRFSYVTRGRYAEQLERWLAHYPAEQMLVVTSEEFYEDTAGTYRRILDFLGLPPWEPPGFANWSRSAPPLLGTEELSERVRDSLDAEMVAENQRLFELLGRDLRW